MQVLKFWEAPWENEGNDGSRKIDSNLTMAAQTGASRVEDSKIGPGILIRTLKQGDEIQRLKTGYTVLVSELRHNSMGSEWITF